MAYIGSTFSNAVTEIIAFGIVMLALVSAFATFFNIMLATTTREYGTFYASLEMVVINGLVGNMDSEPITRALPEMGPVVYAAYLFVVLFVGFTILISIIAVKP